MSLDNKSLMRAGGIGAGVLVVVSILSAVTALFFPLLVFICCCLVIILYAGIGAGYGYFSIQNGNPSDPGQFALGGAIAAAAASIVAGIVGAIVQAIMAALNLGAAATAAQLEAFDLPPEATAAFGMSAGFSIAEAFVSICLGFFIAAALGAIGGAIYGATQQNKAPTAV
jgi:ABC-type Fe3+ transport system permease subunit